MEQNYEFKEQENVIISKLYKQMSFVGVSLLVLGIFFGAFGIYWMVTDHSILRILFALVLGVIFVILGVITNMSSTRFKAVVKTEGDDIEHLMVAIDKLTTWFSIQTITILLGVALAILGFIASTF
ncbi:MAG: hypothetical protein ISR55_04175 [Bacteroidetes bacterium]|nr:hypothetical protein [Bacteroidota bacterium]